MTKLESVSAMTRPIVMEADRPILADMCGIWGRSGDGSSCGCSGVADRDGPAGWESLSDSSSDDEEEEQLVVRGDN